MRQFHRGLLSFFTLLALVNPAIARSQTEAEAQARMESLRAEIANHDRLYFEENAPVISDFAYDQLKVELRTLEAAFPQLANPSATSIQPASTAGAAPHAVPMRSLEKAYSEAEWRAFLRRVETVAELPVTFVLEPKLDGIAIGLRFENGILTQAATRGNGHSGEAVTERILTCFPKLEHLQGTEIPKLLEIRGELYADLAAFDQLNTQRAAAGLESYQHPRNFVGGFLRQEEIDPAEAAVLRLACFGLGACEPATIVPMSQEALHAALANWGLPGLPTTPRLLTGDAVWETAQEFARKDWPFPHDGVVVKVNDRAMQDTLGTGPTAPRWALAIKFAPDQALTVLREIVPEVGRTGVVTPVANFDPVHLSGATLRRASLHHYGLVAAMDLRIGDNIWVERAGAVIPQVVRVELAKRQSSSVPFSAPNKCPECGTVLKLHGVDHICPNRRCPAQTLRQLQHFASEKGLEFEGMGPETIEALLETGLVAAPEDLFALTSTDLEEFPNRFGLSFDDYQHARAHARSRASLERILIALGIPQIGPARARRLASQIETLDALLKIEVESLDLPPHVVLELERYLEDPVHRATIRALAAMNLGTPTTKAKNAVPLGGQIFVFTGELEEFTRAEAQDAVVARGGQVRNSVSGKTDVVVVGSNPGSKLKEAEKRGIPILDEAAFRELLGLEPAK